MKRFAAFLTLPFLTISLASCGQTRPPPEVIKLVPPPETVRECKVNEPRPDNPAIRHLLEYFMAHRDELRECDTRMGALRDWRNDG
jgi:hypothetical protein